MADVFISYKSERRAAAEHLAEILADHGYSVWWDYGLVSGRDFGAQIETELRGAKAIVVLWCTLSRDSEWVKEEAGLAKRLGTLIPATIEPVDLPLGFSMSQTVNLSDWDGAPTSGALAQLLRDIKALAGGSRKVNRDGLERSERAWRRLGAPRMTEFPLIGALERHRPARTLPSALDTVAPAPIQATSFSPAGPPLAARWRRGWVPFAVGGGAIAAIVAAALSMLAPREPADTEGGAAGIRRSAEATRDDGPPLLEATSTTDMTAEKAAASGAAFALPPSKRAPRPGIEKLYTDASAREASVKPACAAAGKQWRSIRGTTDMSRIRIFELALPADCPKLYEEAHHARGALLTRYMDLPKLPRYTDCARAKRDWAALDKHSSSWLITRFLAALPYELDGCRDMREEIRKLSSAITTREMREDNDLRARFD